MTGYYIAGLIMCLIIAAFFPASVAAYKQHRFSKWYVYAVFLFPVALVHSIILKKPKCLAGVYSYSKSDPARRKKQLYSLVSPERKRKAITPGYISAVFFSKLIFGTFTAAALFALFRTFAQDTLLLRGSCVGFALIFSVLLSIVEICRFSTIPMIADEITKRALTYLALSIVCSAPLFVINTFILRKALPLYTEFFTFICAFLSMTLFILCLLNRQWMYYSFFSRFFDYCGISMIAYAIYAAITLILLSVSGSRGIIHAVAMPIQVLNLNNLADSVNPLKLSYIYSSALAHLFVEIIILFSGISCRKFKRKELEARIEYRSAAFRMSRKRILRRHIPKTEAIHIKPL